MSEWQSTKNAPEDIEVDTMIADHDGVRNQVSLIRRGALWFIPGHDMYVHYTPTHWKQKAPTHTGE